MDQTTQASDVTDTLETLERMAASATETPDLAAFLAETAQLLRYLSEQHRMAVDSYHAEADHADALTRRLALYETP